MNRWTQWIAYNWQALCAGKTLHPPAHWLAHPQHVAGFRRAAGWPRNQTCDWALSLDDGCRIHVQCYDEGGWSSLRAIETSGIRTAVPFTRTGVSSPRRPSVRSLVASSLRSSQPRHCIRVLRGATGDAFAGACVDRRRARRQREERAKVERNGCTQGHTRVRCIRAVLAQTAMLPLWQADRGEQPCARRLVAGRGQTDPFSGGRAHEPILPALYTTHASGLSRPGRRCVQALADGSNDNRATASRRSQGLGSVAVHGARAADNV